MSKKIVKTRTRYVQAKKRRTAKKRELHVVPDLLAIGGVADIFVESQTLGLIQGKQYDSAMSYLTTNLTTWNGLKDPVILEVGAIAAKWVGKKLGLNKIGTKGIKLF